MKTRKSQPKQAKSRARRRPAARATSPEVIDQVPSKLKIKRILVPIDFSQESIKALRYAVPFAEQFGATLLLAHIVEPVPVVGEDNYGAAAIPVKSIVNETRERLGEMANEEIEELVPVSVQVRSGKPHNEIAALAKEQKCDLIIIATHGYTGLKHIVLGSTAERVVRHAPCPVLVVREREREFV